MLSSKSLQLFRLSSTVHFQSHSYVLGFLLQQHHTPSTKVCTDYLLLHSKLTRTQQLKTKTFMIIQFLQVRNLGVAQLGDSEYGFHEFAVKQLAVASVSGYLIGGWRIFFQVRIAISSELSMWPLRRGLVMTQLPPEKVIQEMKYSMEKEPKKAGGPYDNLGSTTPALLYCTGHTDLLCTA